MPKDWIRVAIYDEFPAEYLYVLNDSEKAEVLQLIDILQSNPYGLGVQLQCIDRDGELFECPLSSRCSVLWKVCSPRDNPAISEIKVYIVAIRRR